MEFYWYIIIAYAVISNLAAIIMTVHHKKREAKILAESDKRIQAARLAAGE